MLDMNSKYKIYVTRVDKDGNEIESERAVDSKEYAYYGAAWNRARDKYPWRDGYRVIIAQRDPWQKYTRDVQCDICGTIHTVKEFYQGFTSESNVCIKDSSSEGNFWKSYNHLCPDCITKIREFISSMEVD